MPPGAPVRVNGETATTAGLSSTDVTASQLLANAATLLEAAPDAIVITEQRGVIVYVNRQAETVFGYGRNELLGQPVERLMPARFVDAHVGHRAEYHAHAHVRPMADVRRELWGRRRDGTEFPVDINLSPLATAEGTLVISTVRDLSRRRGLENELRMSEARLRSILDSMFAFVALLSPDGTLVDCNEAPLRAMGLRKEAVLGRPFAGGHWFDAPTAAAVRLCIARAAAGEVVPVDFPVRFPDGRERHFENVFSPLRDDSGSVIQIVVSGVDVTERRTATRHLQELSGWQKAILENASYAIISTTPDGVIQTFNTAASRMLGYEPAEVIGVKTPEFLHDAEEVAERARQFSAELGVAISPGFEVFAARARRNLPNEYEWTFVRRDGSRFPVMVAVTALRDAAGEITGFIGIARDLTEQRRVEAELRQVQKLEAVGQLSAGIAHDFNNILTVIHGHASIVELETGLSAETRLALHEIRDSTQRAAHLTRQLLTFSRRQAMRPRLLNCNDLVANLTRMFQRTLGEQVRMELRLSSQDVVVFADQGMLEQVLLNLAVNARDAMPDGGTLSIATAAVSFGPSVRTQVPQARAGAFVCVIVSDTGTGIPPEVVPHIFEPFYTTKEPGKGTGLGLATAYGIIQQHEGWIVVDSETGRGTTFRLFLPRQTVAQPAAVPRHESASTVGGSETILLVEDEPRLRVLIRAVLTRLGYRVLDAATGPLALELWRQHAADVRLLVTDLIMPGGMSGFDLGQQLAREDPALRVIYTSGYSPEIAGRNAELIPDVNFLAKPFEMDRLLLAVRAVLDQWQR